jgi:hypothetical protein
LRQREKRVGTAWTVFDKNLIKQVIEENRYSQDGKRAGKRIWRGGGAA